MTGTPQTADGTPGNTPPDGPPPPPVTDTVTDTVTDAGPTPAPTPTAAAPAPSPAPLPNGLAAAGLAAVRGLWLAVSGIVAGTVLFSLTAVSIALVPVLGIGLLTTPPLLAAVRAHADKRRELCRTWGGLAAVGRPYRPLPPEARAGGPGGRARRCLALLRDPATWRDLHWLLAGMVAGALPALLPLALPAEGVFGVLLAAGLWEPVAGAQDGGVYWYAFVPVDSQGTANYAALLGLGWIALGLRFGPALLSLVFRLDAVLLRPTRRAALARRVARLQQTRHDAVDSSAAELRRIERDLHDGAQARLVAMGMSLSTAEALIEKDPAQAKAVLAQARRSSADALTELRDLVRGIHPPVLAERGLADAVRALALRLPLPVEVTAEVPRRLAEPVETAVYFAVSELLTNAVKHAGARRARVTLRHVPEAGLLHAAVLDDGHGGADPARGSGLRGVERRLGQFDGTLSVDSPPGGPTQVTLDVPCPAPGGPR
ncbi:histidine kinase [Streptomyces sp. TRM70308]|uniref:sensor histidine kinase n=1 Tax=Streptomyces sp. TRM70308 TaxID=3131932 RepID=UPI003D0130BD